MDEKLIREIDLQESGLCVREAENGEKSRLIEGHAVVYGVRSVNLTPWSETREVYEVMERGCISEELLNRSDVVLTAFHDNTAILGRSRNRKGTLRMQNDVRGLQISCELAKTTRADELLSAIERGDISGMSFAFRADEDDSENGVSYEKLNERGENGKVVWIRHVKKVTELYDVTIAGHPAYPQTDVARREIDAFLDKKLGALDEPKEPERRVDEDKEKMECELQEKEERERREIEMQNLRFKRRQIENNFFINH